MIRGNDKKRGLAQVALLQFLQQLADMGVQVGDTVVVIISWRAFSVGEFLCL